MTAKRQQPTLCGRCGTYLPATDCPHAFDPRCPRFPAERTSQLAVLGRVRNGQLEVMARIDYDEVQG
jgi:hypothetical protein